MLALSFIDWLAVQRPDDDVTVVALRGGPLLDRFLQRAEVDVMLEPHEPWDPMTASPERIRQLRARLPKRHVDATLFVSISAGDALAVLEPLHAPAVTWVVELEETLPPGLADVTTSWIAGAEGIAEDIRSQIGSSTHVTITSEFVSAPGGEPAIVRERRRRCLGAGTGELLVVGAGIATMRKAPDLFVELALELRRRADRRWRFAWFGGETDPLFQPLVDRARDLGLVELRFVGNVDDVTPWFAAADVFAHTARLDAFPLVCLHAAAVGTPVVAFSGVGGVPEMMGETFLGAPYPDLAALADAICSLVDDDRRAVVGDSQRRRVERRFLADTAAGAVLDQLLLAIQEHPR